MKKLATAEKLLNDQMLAILEWAAEHPKRWHNIGKMSESRMAGNQTLGVTSSKYRGGSTLFHCVVASA